MSHADLVAEAGKFKVSVVMAVYNGGERMRRSIDSVLAQTWRDFEFLCIDDGSTDGVSGKILDEYAAKDSRMVVIHRENKGVCETLNECYHKAKGEYVARTDQDDVFHPQLLEYCIAATERFRLDFLAFHYRTMVAGKANAIADVLPGVKELRAWNSTEISSDPAGYCSELTRIHTDTWSHFLRRDLAVRHPFHEEYGLTRLLAQLREPITWAVSPEVLYFYDAGVATSMTHQPFSVGEMMWDMADLDHTADLYEDVIAAGDPYGEWATVCRIFILPYLKINYNKIRRSRKSVSSTTRDLLYVAFAKSLHHIFSEKGVSMRHAKLRHKLAYWWLMWKYRGAK